LDKTILRPASEEDFPAIRALIRIVGINPTGLDWHRFVVAVTPDDEMIGCGQVKPRADDTRELASIAVRPAYRQQGIAQAIMVADCATIIDRLLAENPPPLYLICRNGLGPFYERFGFRAIQESEMPPYFKRLTRAARMFMGVNLLVMLRE
jgi:N-acetylglutamate synthase-like GNAT family acetyltransferase